MEERRTSRPVRTQQFLDTVAFGSLLVFASVTPARTLTTAAGGDPPHATSRESTAFPGAPEPSSPDAA